MIFSQNVQTLFRLFSDNVQNVQNMFRLFRQCSECSDSVQTFQTMFRICSDFPDNVQTFQTIFRMFRICSDFSDNVQNVQNLFRMFRVCPDFSVNDQNVQNLFRIFSQCSECSDSVHTFSEFLAQKLVYSEFLDFVVGEATNTNFIIFALTRSRLEPTIYRTRGEHANPNTTDAVTNEGLSYSLYITLIGLNF
jgi:hypothetical protein